MIAWITVDIVFDIDIDTDIVFEKIRLCLWVGGGERSRVYPIGR